jgi:hypothetical protein
LQINLNMKRQSFIRILVSMMIIIAAVYALAAAQQARVVADTNEECMQTTTEDGCPTKTQSEFVLESITRSLLGR